MPNNGLNSPPYRLPTSKTMSPMNPQPNPFDTDLGMSALSIGSERAPQRQDVEAVSAIRMRQLPAHITKEGLRSMLLFAKDFISADFAPSNMPEDQGYTTAIARFQSASAAQEAQSLLHGKQNNPNDPPMIVETIRLSPSNTNNNFDSSSFRANSNSSNASSGGQVHQSSRFNGAFQSMERISPPNGASNFTNGGPSSGEITSPRGNYFSSHSPIDPRQRVSGKSVIGEDGNDEDPTDLLKDPVAYAEGDVPALARRSTHNTHPSSRWNGLSLTTNNSTSPPMKNITSPRNGAIQSPTSALSPSHNLGPNAGFQMSNQHYQRHNYPPVNPADQNPPCNTLYVGNLPIDTSEDELKTMFSKQRGYKRLCFRTKQNGPMCFVEFEDVSFATKALNELYGHPLHNSVKGGIRLSFSKNPLGVRAGQPGGMGPMSPLSPTGPMTSGMGVTGFSTAHGPPPGLAAPPGLANHSGGVNGMNGMNGIMNSSSMGYVNPTSIGPAGMSYGMNGMSDMGVGGGGLRGAHTTAAWAQQGHYGDYMYGR